MPEISVIVPVYKVEPYLKRCVDSILAQTFTDFELILVDDGSPDNCPAICDEYAQMDARIRVIHQANAGVSTARNSGVKESCGSYISFIDSDDYIQPEYLSVLYDLVTRYNADISVVLAKMVTIERQDTGVESVCKKQDVIKKYEYVYEHNDDERLWSAWGKLVARHIIEEFPFPADRSYGEDLAVVYRWLYAANVVAEKYIQMYNYTYNVSGLSKQSFQVNRLGILRTRYELLSFLKEIGLQDSYQRQLHRYMTMLGNYCTKLDECNKIELSSLLKKEIRLRLRTEPSVTIHSHPQCYNCAYPKRMYLYWTVSGILGKIKRLLKK